MKEFLPQTRHQYVDDKIKIKKFFRDAVEKFY